MRDIYVSFGAIYMQLPPVEQRVAKHDAAFADLHTPYKEYRGIYYAQK